MELESIIETFATLAPAASEIPLTEITVEPTVTEVPTVAEEVTNMFWAAGDNAVNFFATLPLYVTRLLIAGLAIFIGAILIRLGRRLIASLVRRHSSRGIQVTVQQTDTLRSLITSVFNYIAYFILLVIILTIFHVDVSSILTVAGVGGIAIGFGAQTLVKDVISGVFIWMEGSIAVGDIVSINDLTGAVEAISIRTTTLREVSGNQFVIPNGDIRTITNLTRDFKNAMVDVRCPYEVSQERIMAILQDEMEKAGQEIVGLSAAPEIWSIVDFQPDCVLVRVVARCPIKENWRIERELRTRIKARFDKEGIAMPHYQRPVVQ